MEIPIGQKNMYQGFKKLQKIKEMYKNKTQNNIMRFLLGNTILQ